MEHAKWFAEVFTLVGNHKQKGPSGVKLKRQAKQSDALRGGANKVVPGSWALVESLKGHGDWRQEASHSAAGGGVRFCLGENGRPRRKIMYRCDCVS